MRTLLLRLPDDLLPPEHLHLDPDALIVAAIIDGDVAQLVMNILGATESLGYVVPLPKEPPSPD
jgi:hypothetical protein